MRQHHCVHRDQHTVTYCCTVNNGTMADGTFVANRERCICIYMECAVVLDICATPYDDGCAIAAHDGIVPDACAFVNGDVADDHCTGGDEDVFGDGRPNIVIRENWHDLLLRFLGS